jgi:hypothetical protein
VAIRLAISSHEFIGTIFFSGGVNSERYLLMLQTDFVPQLVANQLPIGAQWFMQDGAAPHAANVLDFLSANFGPCVIPLSRASQLRKFLATS